MTSIIKHLKQPSTIKGLALVGSAVALATGNGHLFNAEMTEQGVQMGGLIGVAIPAFVGLWETVRNEFK